jgi:hypothetical protein
MRSDFHEVLIERPRSGMRIKTRRDGKPQARLWDGEDGFEDCVPGRPNRTKWFDDHLSPLRRWLRAQCNRPWDKVYSELCAGIDTRSVVGQHLRDHALQEVTRNCLMDAKGKFWTIDYPGYRAVKGLYVHPRTGLLRWQNEPTKRQYLMEYAESQRQKYAHLHAVDAAGGYACLNGTWYQVQLRPLTLKERHRYVGLRSYPYKVYEALSGDLLTPHGLLHISDKRQLSSRELRAHGLQNTFSSTE